jgi:hypothetical protein
LTIDIGKVADKRFESRLPQDPAGEFSKRLESRQRLESKPF